MLVAVQAIAGNTLAVTDNGTTPSAFVMDACCLNAQGRSRRRTFSAPTTYLPGAGTYAVTVTQSPSASLQIATMASTGVANGPPYIHLGGRPAITRRCARLHPERRRVRVLLRVLLQLDHASPESVCAASGEFTLQQVQANGSAYEAGAVADAIVTSPASRAGGWTLSRRADLVGGHGRLRFPAGAVPDRARR